MKRTISSGLSGSWGRSVAECQIQTSPEEFVDTTDPAMERTVENPSAAVEARKASDTRSNMVQRIEAASEPSSDKVRVHESGAVLTLIGDECREIGGTRELKVLGKVHSPSKRT